ncbi:MAG TPA: FtsQ-type POTRA domain-containing protein [Candidatus Paceibacterota bacterium]|nr:FtsQ-type POTRA domain-containing protein [Candidatus Paceibacterota bacterium]
MHKNKITELSRKKRRRFFLRIFIFIFMIYSLSYGIYYFFNHPKFQIKNIEIEDLKYTEKAVILKIFELNTSGKHVNLFSKNNILFFSESIISNNIKDILSVENVSIRREFPDILRVEIVEHEPWGIWCENINTKCYLVNKNGLAFVSAPEIILEDLIKISDDKNKDILGNNFVSEDVFSKFVRIEKLLRKINVSISQITTKDYQTFILQTKDGPKLFIDSKNDPVEVVNNLKTTIEQESIHEIQFKNIEYVDLRFRGKAYYKIK